MIQRIQSIYLLLATLCFSFFLLFPVFKINNGTEVISEKAVENTFLVILAVLLIVGTLGNVFLYKNRLLQIRIGWGLFGVNLFLLGLLGYHYYLETRNAQEVHIAFGAVFPAIALFLILLAIYNINKDEKLVRSLDRLR
jgi:hypothetical protein